jgi:hypothetical protein
MEDKERTIFSSELKHIFREIEEIRRSQLLELEEYYRVIVTPSNQEEVISEYRQEYSAAVDQISSQMKSSDERRLEAALRTMEGLETDELKGGPARLLSLIEAGVKSSEDAIETLKARLTASREEFISLRHSDTLLEKTAQISYEKVRDAYSHLLRLSHKRSNENDLLWIELEARGREWMMSEMKAILNSYRSLGSSQFEVTQSDRVNQHRLAAGRRLQRFGDRVLASSQRQTRRMELYNDTNLRVKKIEAFEWRKRQCDLMNDWLETTESQMGQWYGDSIQELSERISEIRYQIQFLDLHAKKLTHLRRLSQKSYQTIRERSLDLRRGSIRSSVAVAVSNSAVISGKRGEGKKESEESKGLPPVSMNLGTRMWSLSRSVGVEYEEGVLLLTQLLHTVNPDALVLQRLSQHVTHYEAILAKRKS